MSAAFVRWFGELAAIGRLPDGGHRRFAWTDEDRAARAWFADIATELGLDVEQDRNGNLWAWWGSPSPGAIVTGSHLDTVARAGAYDGALGVVSGFAAVAALQARGAPPRPGAVVAFSDEEGGRFNTPCFGSSLMVGAKDAADVLDRTDADGVSLCQAVAAIGVDPDALGPDPERVEWIDAMVELHIEQGRGLVHHNAPVAAASGIWPHSRWVLRLEGEANHAGTTQLADRRDPTLVLAAAIEEARYVAEHEGGLLTVGRITVEPNSPNTLPSLVVASLDARARDDATLDRLVSEWIAEVTAHAKTHGVGVEYHEESRSAGVVFDQELLARLRGVPVLATGAGHDAGVLANATRTAMLFVRNPTGISHSPAEHASVDDCLAGVDALTVVLEDLLWR